MKLYVHEVGVRSRNMVGKVILGLVYCLALVIGSGLVWFGMVGSGLVWFGMVWYGLVWFELPSFVFRGRQEDPMLLRHKPAAKIYKFFIVYFYYFKDICCIFGSGCFISRY
jgi:hypothetical protein